jgi:hypothetical protein
MHIYIYTYIYIYLCFTAALLLLYCCFTAALLLLLLNGRAAPDLCWRMQVDSIYRWASEELKEALLAKRRARYSGLRTLPIQKYKY